MQAGRQSDRNAETARDMAVSLLASEGALGGSPSDVVAQAAGRVLQRMQHTLARWFGIGGIHALLSRALERAREVCPSIDSVYVAAQVRESSASIPTDVFAALRSLAPDEALDACTTAIAEFITLLGRLLGEDTAGRLVEHARSGAKAEAGPLFPSGADSDSAGA